MRKRNEIASEHLSAPLFPSKYQWPLLEPLITVCWKRRAVRLRALSLRPKEFLKFDVNGLRELGVSRQKASYVLDLAGKVHSGVVELEGLQRESDDEVIEVLTQVKGIGIWTAQMFLMFSLGRLDIFPCDDLGIRNAIAKRYELGELPSKSKMLEISTPWRPYSTVACWYLWQSLDLEDG